MEYSESRRIPIILTGHIKGALSNTWEGAWKLTFGALVIAASLTLTFYSSRANFSLVEMANVLTLGMVVSGVLLLGSQAIALRSKTAANAALATVTLACAFTGYIVHTELFFPANRAALLGICSAALFGLFVAFRVIDERRWGGLALSGSVLIWIAWPIWPNLLRGLSIPGGLLSLEDPRFWALVVGMCGAGLGILLVLTRYIDESHWGGVALLSVVSIGISAVALAGPIEGRSSDSANWAKHPDIRDVRFAEKPNVYFVGFDSVVPDHILLKHLGVETTEFHRVFDKEMRRFRNLFANSISTKYSINTLMALSQNIFLAEHRPSYFTGQRLSPLVYIMRDNGYETTSIYDNFYFGHTKGPYIDSYVVNRKSGAICSLLDEDVRKWAFWGYCRIIDANWSRDEVIPPGDFLVRELTSRIERDRPQFVIAHIYLPGHTSGSFRYHNLKDREAFTESYVQKSNEAAIYLERIVDFLTDNDPSAVLFVFGDHGMWLSRGMMQDEDPTFYFQDRFGVLGGVYPRDRCKEYFDDAEAKGYMTTLDAVHSILGCLSGGQEALLEPRYDRFFEVGLDEEHDYRYEDYLYE